MVEPIELVPLSLYLSVALTIFFLCSLLEAVLLSVTHPYIESLTRKGSKVGFRLKELKEHTDRSLAAILTLNTIAHTIGAAGVGTEVYDLFGSAWVAVASVILTLLILVFSEVIPKSLGVAKWKRLAPFTAKVIKALIFITYPLVWVLERISKVFQPEGYRAEVTREEMIAAAELGEDQGILEADETRVIRNLLRLDNIPAEDVMTPNTVMLTFQKDRTVEDVVKNNSPVRFSRIPVTNTGLDDIIGIVLRNEILEAYSAGKGDVTLESMAHPVQTVSPSASVGDLLDEFIKRQDHIFLVVDEYGGTEGIITLEDAVETLLGVEIVDETDSVEDMRKLAREQWEGRRKRNVLIGVETVEEKDEEKDAGTDTGKDAGKGTGKEEKTGKE